MSRRRLDLLLVDRGLAPTRARAQAMVLAGEVFVDGRAVEKPGTAVDSGGSIDVRPRRPAFVSRGGVKLDHALTVFGIDVRGRVALDVGASAGGFTDCLLQRGAARVYAVDVGTGQLAWTLRVDPRVVSIEQRDIRALAPDVIGGPADLATVDVAFISLFKVLPAVIPLVRAGGPVVALLKPQFEVGPKVAKGGVVADPAAHVAVLTVALAKAADLGVTVRGVAASPISGPAGNLEFFLWLDTASQPAATVDVAQIVADAHARIRGRAASPIATGGR